MLEEFGQILGFATACLFCSSIEQREFGVDVEMGKVAHAVLS